VKSGYSKFDPHLKHSLESVDRLRKPETENSGVQDENVQRRVFGQKFGRKISDRVETSEIETHRRTPGVRPLAPDFANRLQKKNYKKNQQKLISFILNLETNRVINFSLSTVYV
jgi:hypothetical protein